MRAHPGFAAACEALAADALAHFAASGKASRWLTRDLGRSVLYMVAVILEATPMGLSLNTLAAVASATGVCSRGRVVAFVDYAHRAGQLTIPAGAEPWTKRRLSLTPPAVDFFRTRIGGALGAASRAAPELSAAIPALRRDAALRAGLAALGGASGRLAELGVPPNPPIQLFLDREGGMRVLQDLLVGREPDRVSRLVGAGFSRSRTARRCGVSRAHLNKLIADAGAAGLLAMPARDRVIFSSELEAGLEFYFALEIQILRLMAEAILRSPT